MGVVESGGLLWLLQVNDLLLVAEAVRVRGLWESKGLEIRLKDERFLEREAVVVEAGFKAGITCRSPAFAFV